MKQSDGFTRLWPTVITISAMFGSVSLLALAMRTIPLSTAYPMWTGMGAVSAFGPALQSLNEQATDGGSHHGRDTHHCRTGDDEAEQC
jgi:quaternary ammonium compound-resistance protein SugE